MFIGHDWHWFKRETFRRRLELTYKDSKARELTDRLWLCRLLVVFAQGETYNSELAPEIRLGDGTTTDISTNSDNQVAPGTEFFEQALSLLNVCYEDPSIEQVEALNLVVSIHS